MAYEDKVDGSGWDWLLPKGAEECAEAAEAAKAQDRAHFLYELLDVLKLVECSLMRGDAAFRTELCALLEEQEAKHRDVQDKRGNLPIELAHEYILSLVDKYGESHVD
jgi:phosphoribosyl-ATP pyrophosphohydrolase